MGPLLADAVVLVVVLIVAWVLPAAVMRGLAPSLAETSHMRNYRGRTVFLGLGAVWLVWSAGIMAVRALIDAVGSVFPDVQDALFHVYFGAFGVALSGMPLLLVGFAFAFGLVDDMFGSSGHKGFGGHLGALKQGRLTSGALKLLGIGMVAAFYGWSASARYIDGVGESVGGSLLRIGAWVLATLVIGLATNLFNLLDLRPGRAIKSYIVMVLPLAVGFAVTVLDSYSAFAESVGDAAGAASAVGATEWGVMILASVIMFLGPVLAIWRYDLGESGMLGDAGSNVLGAIVGFLLVGVLPAWGVLVAAVVLLGLNLLSERVSFSAVIERVGVLRRLDSLGRLAESTDPSDPVTDGDGRSPADGSAGPPQGT